MDLRPRVICGFPGVGKSTLFNKLRDQISILDSDSSKFDKAHFPANYIEHIQQMLEKGYWILCSTHSEVRKALQAAGIKYALVHPVGTYLKAEYMQRYRERGSPQPFLDLMQAKFESFVEDVLSVVYAMKIGLDQGEYMERLKDDILRSDQNQRRHVFHVPYNVRHIHGDITEIGQPNQTVEFLNGFMAGQIYQTLSEDFERGTFNERSFIVRKDNVSIGYQLAKVFDIHVEVLLTSNPQARYLRFTKNIPDWQCNCSK